MADDDSGSDGFDSAGSDADEEAVSPEGLARLGSLAADAPDFDCDDRDAGSEDDSFLGGIETQSDGFDSVDDEEEDQGQEDQAGAGGASFRSTGMYEEDAPPSWGSTGTPDAAANPALAKLLAERERLRAMAPASEPAQCADGLLADIACSGLLVPEPVPEEPVRRRRPSIASTASDSSGSDRGVDVDEVFFEVGDELPGGWGHVTPPPASGGDAGRDPGSGAGELLGLRGSSDASILAEMENKTARFEAEQLAAATALQVRGPPGLGHLGNLQVLWSAVV